jgi:hypothetical protein
MSSSQDPPGGAGVAPDARREPLAETMVARHRPWIRAPTGAGRPLKVEVVEAPLDCFISPAFASAREVHRVLTAYDGAVFRATSYRLAWWFDVGRGTGRVALAHGERDPAPRAMENFLRGAATLPASPTCSATSHGSSISFRATRT